MVNTIIEDLTKLANALDKKGLHKAADGIDNFIKLAIGDGLNPKKDQSPKLDSKTRNAINTSLDQIATGSNHKYYQSVGEAFELMTNAMKNLGVAILQEDNTPFAGFFAGKEGQAKLDLAPTDASKGPDDMHTPYSNTMLVLSWHKMHNNTYEVGAYLS